MIKILALGNSFSQNATTYLDKIVDGLYVRNLYIGGCSLETHYGNLKEDKKAYELQIDAVKVGDLVSAKEIMCSEKWDYVTVQQASGFSGVYDSYYPYITEVIKYIKEYCPQAKIVFHQTWAYATYSNHIHFPFYNNSQKVMYDGIISASNRVAKENGLPIIEAGKAIQTLRERNPVESEYNCDGFHMTNMGCFIVGAVWGKFFGKKLNGYFPEGIDVEEAKKNLAILGIE